MRIFSAQLFKLYTFFLAAIATVVLGAPLVRRKGIHGSFMCSEQNALIKRSDIPFEKRCSEEYSLYISSFYDEICVDRTEFPETPHAFCIKKKCSVSFDNFNRPDIQGCGSHSYSVPAPVNLIVAMKTYSTSMKPIQVDYQTVTYKGDPISVNQVNNSTRVINGYNGENIDFCFNGGITAKVQAFAAAWISD
ncbi:hypothetical protein C1646_760691 [Rhizophagus diaphanus]|nr:hypothetical protein C1646_760691 [Rhizophagus diaphanus] [Rhizophagus sp. MUCL 43196]